MAESGSRAKAKHRKSGPSLSQSPSISSPSQSKGADQRDWDSLSDKKQTDMVNGMVRYLLCASSKKVPVKRDEIVRTLMPGKRCFNICLNLAKQKLEEEFGLSVLERQKGSQKVLIIVNKLSTESRELIMQKSDDDKSDYGLLFTVLSFLIMRPNQSMDEDYLYKSVLGPLGIENGVDHPSFGLIKSKLDHFIEQCYVEKKKKIVGNESTWEYSWGPRAEIEVDKKEMLKAMCEIYEGESFDVWEKQFGHLIKD